MSPPKKQKKTKRIKDELKRRQGHAVLKQPQVKHDVYAPLIAIGEKQFEAGARTQKPIFWAGVASTYGEFGPETIQIQEWLTAAYARKVCREGPRQDGEKIEDLTASFRNKFREGIIMAVAKGQSIMINNCGLPAITCKKNIVMDM